MPFTLIGPLWSYGLKAAVDWLVVLPPLNLHVVLRPLNN
jgi:hypothetical protein